MRMTFADPAVQTLLARCSYLVLISLAGCARADPPEAFVADPSLQNDYTASLPATGSSQGFKYQIVQGTAILEGDIVLGGVDSNGDLNTRLVGRGVGQTSALSRWPDGIVIYEAPEDSSPLQQYNIAAAMKHWTDNTNMVFVERTDENADDYPNYIVFQDSGGCASHVGMIGNAQPVYLSDACSVGSVIHELGHAIGLFHEHTRPDRDGFVTIDWDEVIEEAEINFELLTAGVTEYSEYDYGSIMHYGETFFSKSGNPTIIVADGIEIGQREGLSELDIASANAMYATDLAVTAGVSNTSENVYSINVATYNYGELGANQIELLLRLDDVLEWQDISQDSGWSCVTDDATLRCTRDTFIEQTQSLFNVQVSSVSDVSDDDLQVRLSSLTEDFDLTNNSINDDDTDWDSTDTDGDSSSNLLTTRNVDGDETPGLQAANEESESEEAASEEESNTDDTDSASNTDNASGSSSTGSSTDSTTVASSSSATESASSGGSLSGFILALLGASLAFRRAGRAHSRK